MLGLVDVNVILAVVRGEKEVEPLIRAADSICKQAVCASRNGVGGRAFGGVDGHIVGVYIALLVGEFFDTFYVVIMASEIGVAA